MLNSNDLKKLLNAGNGARIEIMPSASATSARLARSLVALANTQGGVVILPMHVEHEKIKANKNADPAVLVEAALDAMFIVEPRLIIPLPYFVGDAEKPDALVIEVPEGLPHVYQLDGRFFGRNNARVTTLSSRQLRDLLVNRNEGVWEAGTPSGASSDDIDWKRVNTYADSVANLGEPSVEDMMLRRGCVVKRSRNVRPTYAGLLLFGKQPQRWVRGAEVIVARFKGEEMDDAFSRQTISGTLPDQIRRVEHFVNENLSSKSILSTNADWKREDEQPYPPSVLREAIVNAIAHRDYSISGNQTQVLMFSNRIEVRSPGKLPAHVTVKNILRERYSRNEAIVQVLADFGFIERLGYGIDRIVRAMKDNGHAPPKFEETDNGFCVTLYSKINLAPQEVTTEAMSATQRTTKMLAHIKQHERISLREYQELCPDVNPDVLRGDFIELTERGKIMRVGDKRGTYYILK